MTSLIVLDIQPENMDAEPSHKTTEDDTLKAQLEDIAAKKEQARALLLEYNIKMAKMLEDISKQNAYIHQAIAEAMTEINSIQAEIKDKINENYVPDDLDDEFGPDVGVDDGPSFGETEYERYDEEEYSEDTFFFDEAPEAPRSESPELKELFGKIAKRTHPDKTDDPALHMLFVTAKEYRNQGNLQGLKDIWECLHGRGSRLLSKLMQQLEQERQELALIERQLSQFLKSMDYHLLTLYGRDRTAVYIATRQQAESKLNQVLAQLEMLQRMTGKYVEPPTYSVFNFA